MNDSPAHDAIVLGGGLGGLAAARGIADAGYACLLIEARDRLGGRTLYREFNGTGPELEFGGAWILPQAQHHIAAELARYDLGLIQSPEPRTFHWDLDGELRTGAPLRKGERTEFERMAYELMAAAARVNTSEPLDRQGIEDLDISLDELMTRLDLSPAVRDFIAGWGVLYGGCREPDNSLLHVLLDVVEYGHSVVAFFDALDDQLELGTRSLVEAIASDLDREPMLEAPVVGVDQSDAEVTVRTIDGRAFTARAAIVALPVNVWSQIEFDPPLSAGKQSVAKPGHAGHAAKVWVLAESVPENLVAVGPGGGLSWLSTERRTEGGDLLVGFGIADELDVSDRDAVAAAVEHLCPSARVLAVDGHDWTSDPFARGAWAWYRPGQLSAHFSDLQAREGRLLFAGSDIASEWMSWMDGALASGQRAATELTELLACETGRSQS